jgi:HNH endonuclease
LRAVVTEALAAGTYPYCGWALNEANFSVDHHNPISRDGDFTIGNILVCHLRCNKIKGNLTSHEFLHLAQFPPEVGKDVLARLYAGAFTLAAA